MGLLAGHGLTHHLLRAARLWRCLSSSSSYAITMAATPIKMLKWARCASNSRLLIIVTTAGMTGASKVTDFLYLRPYLAGKLTITARSPAGGRQITWRWATNFSTSAGDRQDPWRSSAGALPVAVQSPDGDRQVIADPVIRAVQGHQNRPTSYRSRKIGIRQKSGKNRAVIAGFIIFWDVGLTQHRETSVRYLSLPVQWQLSWSSLHLDMLSP